MKALSAYLFSFLLLSSCKAQGESIQLPKTSNPLPVSQHKTAATDTNSVIILDDAVSSWSLGFIAPKIPPNTRCPLIIYLHGGVGTDRTDKGSKAWEMFAFIEDSFPAIIASPSANRLAPWWSETGISRIYRSVEEMISRFPVDTTKIFLAGVSDGATGMVAISSFPNHPFAGFLGASGYPPMFGNSLSADQMKHTPIHLYISGKDRLYPSDSVFVWCKKAQTNGVPISYTVMPEAEHGFDFKFEEKSVIVSLFRQWKKQSRM